MVSVCLFEIIFFEPNACFGVDVLCDGGLIDD